MIQVDLEVRTGAARFRVRARARSIRRAVRLTGSGYPGAEVKLVLPVEPNEFFLEEAAGSEESIGVRLPQAVAG